MENHETESQQLRAEIQALREELCSTRQAHETTIQQILDLQTDMQQQLRESTSAFNVTIPPPDVFEGKRDDVDRFIHELDVYFYVTSAFHSDDAKIRFACSLMKGNAQSWTKYRIGKNPTRSMPITYAEYCTSVCNEFKRTLPRNWSNIGHSVARNSQTARNQVENPTQVATDVKMEH